MRTNGRERKRQRNRWNSELTITKENNIKKHGENDGANA